MLSALMMGLYFSGSATLQQWIAPTIEGMHPFTWREFGVLEMLQNLLLIWIVVILTRSALATDQTGLRAIFIVLAMGFLFVLLEEIDYGWHFIEFFGGEGTSLQQEGWNRNVHNRVTSEGVQYGSYMKTAAKLTLVFVFLLAPFLLRNSKFEWVRLFTPSRWSAASVVLFVVLSRIAHLLDGAGLGQVNGVAGNLEHNISEFREFNMYYLFLIYFTELNQRLSPARK